MEEVLSIQMTSDGGYIMTGSTMSFGAGNSDVYLIRADSMGNIIWTRTYGGAGVDLGHAVQQTTDGGYIVAGRTLSFGAGFDDVYLIKTDAAGDTLWTKAYGGGGFDGARDVRQTTDGGYIVGCHTNSFGAGAIDIYLIKTDSIGNVLWAKTYGGTKGELIRSVRQTTDGGYIALGGTQSFVNGNDDIYLVKTDSYDTLQYIHHQ